MTVVHVYPTFVESRREGITNNVDALCHSLADHGLSIENTSPRFRLRDLNRHRTLLRGGWQAHRAVVDALDDPDVDLVHFHVSIPALGAFARLARRRRPSRKTPVLLHVWNAIYRSDHVYGRVPFADRLPHRALNGRRAARWGLSGADAVLVASHYQARQLRALELGIPIHVLPNGVDAQTYRPPTTEEREQVRASLGLSPEPLLAYYGHLSPWKGLDVLLDALPAIVRGRPGLQLAIAHTRYGRAGGHLKERLRRMGLDRRVRLLQDVHVPSLLAAADVVALPTVAPVGTACHPNVLLESMAAGRPVVAGRVGSIPEVVEHGRNGRLAAPGDPASFAEHLGILADDAGERRRLGAAAREHMIEHHSWKQLAPRFAALYRHLWASPEALPIPTPLADARRATVEAGGVAP